MAIRSLSTVVESRVPDLAREPPDDVERVDRGDAAIGDIARSIARARRADALLARVIGATGRRGRPVHRLSARASLEGSTAGRLICCDERRGTKIDAVTGGEGVADRIELRLAPPRT